MTGSSGAVRKTSPAFDLLKKSLTYPRLLRQLVQEVGLLFLRSPELNPGAVVTPQAEELLGLHPNTNPHTVQEHKVKPELARGRGKEGDEGRVTLCFTGKYIHLQKGALQAQG